MKTRIFLIRHGITTWNKAHRYCGCRDVPLSQEGKEQAKALRGELKGVEFERIYSSDRKRAMQTAGIIFGNKKIIKVKGLREINFGVLEGLRHKVILEKYGKAYRAWLKDPFKAHIPKAEKLRDFQRRVVSAIEKISKANRGKTIAVVCHGGSIAVLLSKLRNSKRFWNYIPKAGTVTIAEIKNG